MAAFPKAFHCDQALRDLALLATATVVLALVAVVNARRHAALTEEYEAAARARRTSSASTA